MEFDACEHKIRQIIIKAGREIRRIKGLPEEKNITVIFNEVADLFGVKKTLTSRDANHLPSPHEMKNDKGMFIIPRKDCPHCGRKEGLSLKSLCRSCIDSEGGKYNTMYSCEEVGPDGKPIGCGFKSDKSEKFMSQIMTELNPDWDGGIKKDLGIKTITDEGLK
jgi:hypothetical protein